MRRLTDALINTMRASYSMPKFLLFRLAAFRYIDFTGSPCAGLHAEGRRFSPPPSSLEIHRSFGAPRQQVLVHDSDNTGTQ